MTEPLDEVEPDDTAVDYPFDNETEPTDADVPDVDVPLDDPDDDEDGE